MSWASAGLGESLMAGGGDLLAGREGLGDTLCDLTKVDDPLLDLTKVGDRLLDLTKVGDSSPDLVNADDPARDLEGVGDPLRDLEGVEWKVLLRLARPWGVAGALLAPWWCPSLGGTRRLRLLGREGPVGEHCAAGVWLGLTGALCVGGRENSQGDRWVSDDLWEWVGEVWAETDARCRRWRRTLAALDPMLNKPDMLLWDADSASAFRRLH